MYPVQDQLYTAAEVVLSPFNHVPNNGKVELIVVMVIVPLILNSTQFVVQDTFLKRGRKRCGMCRKKEYEKESPIELRGKENLKSPLLDENRGEMSLFTPSAAPHAP